LNEAIRLRPDYADAYYNLGYVFLCHNEFDEAVNLFHRALKIEPDYVEAYNNLGVALGRQGRFDEATAQLNKTLQLNPNYAEAYCNLGYVLLCQNQFDQAVTQLEKAVQLDLDSEKSRYYLAIALRSKGRLNEAVTNYEAALKLRPDWIEPMNSLAWLLAVHNDAVFYNPQKAVQLAQRVCDLTDNRNAVFLDTLAVAYAADGNFPQAVATAQKALDIAGPVGNNQLAEQIQKRLDLFKTGQPYTELVQNKQHGD
jgi:Flp pilus assembly protein TadD